MVFGVVCGSGAVMLKISEISFKADGCLLQIIVSGIVGVRLRMSFIRSSAALVAASSYNILGKGRLSAKKSTLS